MRSIQALVEMMHANNLDIRHDMSCNTTSYIRGLLDNAKEYLLAPDLNKNTWQLLSEDDREMFYLFLLINEAHHYNRSSKNFLINVSSFLPKDTNVYSRLRLFGKLSKMSHVQHQYEKLAMDFLGEANVIYKIEDPYIDRESVKHLLLNYFHTFIETARESFASVGQSGLLEAMLPEFAKRVQDNAFAMAGLNDLISIIKNNYQRNSAKIAFGEPLLVKIGRSF